MADRNDASSNMIAATGATGRVHSTDSGSVVVEFLDAARSAAESLLEEQKRQVADRVSGIAEALHSAAHSLEQSQNQTIARYIAQAGEQLGQMSRTMHERRWAELVAVATGFVVGRLLWTAAGGRRHDGTWSSQTREPARTVTAAVSSGSNTAAGELTGNPHPITGSVEIR